MKQLQRKINELDQQPIQKYSAITGRYTDSDVVYYLRNVYGGTIKKCSIEIEIPKARLYEQVYRTSDITAISAYILRDFYVNVRIKNDELQQSDANKQKGYFCVYHTGMRVIPNNIVEIDRDFIKIKLEVKLPVNTTAFEGKLLAMNAKTAEKKLNKRRKDIISSKSLSMFLLKNLPALVESFTEDFSEDELYDAVMLYRNQEYIRSYIKSKGYVSFLGNGSVLPRKGLSDYKNPRGAKVFCSPLSLEIDIELPDKSHVLGMGIMDGVTVILGDAYQGKSTLLSAIYEGIYNHVKGDGREYVITCESALKVSAENGRSVQNTDISFYLRNLPSSVCNTKNFSTVSASGSTSQAAAVVEAVESGCQLMLLDEDNCANNFMYKEKRMREIFVKSSTVPFIDRAHALYLQFGVSAILAVGASAEYLDVADHALLIRDYEVYEFLDYEKANYSDEKLYLRPRIVNWSNLRKPEVCNQISVVDAQTLRLGTEYVDVGSIIPNVSSGQMNFTVYVLNRLIRYDAVSGKTLPATLDVCYAGIDQRMKDARFYSEGEYFEYVRKQDIMQILYRCKNIQFK